MQSHYLTFAKKTAQEAGKILLSYFGNLTKEQIHLKGRRDLVTQADVEAEAYICQQIVQNFPNHSILGEEKTKKDGSEDVLWLIDPLDGTTNFTHGHPYFSVSIAMEYKKQLQLGVVYAPYFQEFYFAERNFGSWLEKDNQKTKLHVSVTSTLEDSLLATGFYYNRNDTSCNNLDNFAHILLQTQGIRRCGSAALELCYVASGKYDGFWELWLQPFDVAAGVVLVEEAGGKVTDCGGNSDYLYGHSIIASNSHIHQAIQNNILSYPKLKTIQ
ncbi:MAG TPA: inositol monophosphatase family protein [Planctomycetota bacterium]|nr:inositol monophosphatase family protein [Planctomycetota bacterium]HRU52148.1 inositol monophosphatase family protein [Planctomycetota bacterium]